MGAREEEEVCPRAPLERRTETNELEIGWVTDPALRRIVTEKKVIFLDFEWINTNSRINSEKFIRRIVGVQRVFSPLRVLATRRGMISASRGMREPQCKHLQSLLTIIFSQEGTSHCPNKLRALHGHFHISALCAKVLSSPLCWLLRMLV